MNNELFKPRRTIEKKYAAAITYIMRGLGKRLKNADSPFLMLEALRGLARSPTLDRSARVAAQAMATALFHDGARSWREAARKGSRGRLIYLLLKQEAPRRKAIKGIVDENAKLIKSMSADAAKKVVEDMARGQMEGKRPEELMRDVLARWPTLTEARARLIARTETSKAASALTRVRAENAGFQWYEWKTSEDARVRSSHRHMDGVLCRWSDPPVPERLIHEKEYGAYHPGEIFNCRCYAAPLIDCTDVSWPHKVYFKGKISTMTLAQFKNINRR